MPLFTIHARYACVRRQSIGLQCTSKLADYADSGKTEILRS